MSLPVVLLFIASTAQHRTAMNTLLVVYRITFCMRIKHEASLWVGFDFFNVFLMAFTSADRK